MLASLTDALALKSPVVWRTGHSGRQDDWIAVSGPLARYDGSLNTRNNPQIRAI